MNESREGLAVDILEYEGPLDLLNQLIERNKIPVNRVSIVSIADQYLAVIREKPVFDMELASSFLLMAATLIHLKSAMLLPERQQAAGEDPTDAGDLLVMRLLQYRRCRLLASHLRARHAGQRGIYGKPPTPPEQAGILRERTVTRLERGRFEEAGQEVASRNENRFDDSSKRVEQILERERISLAERMRYIVKHIAGRSRIFFYELFPPELPALERITGFLAMLELVFQNKAGVTQKGLFAPIMIERKGR